MTSKLWLVPFLFTVATFAACPQSGKLSLNTVNEYLFEGPNGSSLAVTSDLTFDSTLNGITFYKPVSEMKYTILKEVSASCEWTSQTAKFLSSANQSFTTKDSAYYSIFRDTDKILISENTYLPLGTMESHIQLVEASADTANSGLTESNGSYYINGDLFAISSSQTSLYFGQLYAKKKDGNYITLTATTDKDSSSLTNRMVGALSTNNIETDSVYWQILKLNYEYTPDEITPVIDPISKINLGVNYLILPEGTQWIKIRDIRGKSIRDYNQYQEKTLYIGDLPRGMYLIETNGKAVEKIMIH